MEDVAVIYLGTDLLDIKNDIKSDVEFKARHCQYVMLLLNSDIKNNTALYSVEVASQFEHSNPILSYRLTTRSEFKFQNFILHEDRAGLLEDYVFFAYRKHIDILRDNLTCQNYIDKIEPELEPFQYKNSIEMMIESQIRDNRILIFN